MQGGKFETLQYEGGAGDDNLAKRNEEVRQILAGLQTVTEIEDGFDIIN